MGDWRVIFRERGCCGSLNLFHDVKGCRRKSKLHYNGMGSLACGCRCGIDLPEVKLVLSIKCFFFENRQKIYRRSKMMDEYKEYFLNEWKKKRLRKKSFVKTNNKPRPYIHIYTQLDICLRLLSVLDINSFLPEILHYFRLLSLVTKKAVSSIYSLKCF